MVIQAVRRLVVEDEGMEMVEWSIVGAIFALTCALLWSTVRNGIGISLTNIGSCIGDSSSCP